MLSSTERNVRLQSAKPISDESAKPISDKTQKSHILGSLSEKHCLFLQESASEPNDNFEFVLNTDPGL